MHCNFCYANSSSCNFHIFIICQILPNHLIVLVVALVLISSNRLFVDSLLAASCSFLHFICLWVRAGLSWKWNSSNWNLSRMTQKWTSSNLVIGFARYMKCKQKGALINSTNQHICANMLARVNVPRPNSTWFENSNELMNSNHQINTRICLNSVQNCGGRTNVWFNLQFCTEYRRI